MEKPKEKAASEPVLHATPKKASVGKRFCQWVYTKGEKDKPSTYCGQRTAWKWAQLIFAYICFYSLLFGYFAICFTVMISYVPDRVGGDGPILNSINDFGHPKIHSASTSFALIAADNGAFASTSGAFNSLRSRLSQAEYAALQTQLTTDVGISGSKFLYDNCTVGLGGCTAASNYGAFGPVVLVTPRNRKWDRPLLGSTCTLSCTYELRLGNGSLSTRTIISANHFWRLNPADGTWVNGQTSLYCVPFRNQPNYRVYTAISLQGMETSTVSDYILSCNVADFDEGSTSAELKFVA